MRVKRLRLQTASFVFTAVLAVGCSGALPQATVAPTTVLLFLLEGTIYELDGEFAEPVGRPGDEPFLTASGMVSSIREGRMIQIHRYEGEGGLALVREITLPERVVATVDGSSDRIVLKESRVWTTALADGVLYVTGELGDYTLGFYDLDRSKPPFKPMRVPRKVGPPKAFDELLVDGDSLLAVDDIEYPKWLVIYDISRPRAPKLTKAIELPSGTYKRIPGVWSDPGIWLSGAAKVANMAIRITLSCTTGLRGSHSLGRSHSGLATCGSRCRLTNRGRMLSPSGARLGLPWRNLRCRSLESYYSCRLGEMGSASWIAHAHSRKCLTSSCTPGQTERLWPFTLLSRLRRGSKL